MTASEARNKALIANMNGITIQFEMIMDLIEKAANKGEYSIYFYEAIKQDVINKLTSYPLSFIITNPFEKNILLSIISW